MIKRLRPALLLLLCLGLPVSAEQPAPLSYLTEAYPPYNYSDDNILRGIAVDLLISATQHTSKPVTRSQIRLQPWPRAYRTALSKPDTVLFSTTRTEEREKLFKWAGPIATTRVVLLARKSKQIRIESPADLQQYRIGTVPDDIGEQLLLAMGVSEKQLKHLANAIALAQQLQVGRIDLWAYEENVARWFLSNAKLEPDDFESVYLLKQGELWFAFNPQVSDAQVSELQQAIDHLRQQPGRVGKTRYDDILLDYL